MNERQLSDSEPVNELVTRQTRRHLQTSLAMFAMAAAAYFFSKVVARHIDGFGLAIAAATALSVGIAAQPDAYRRANGSLRTAFLLLLGMWSVPVMLLILWSLQ